MYEKIKTEISEKESYYQTNFSNDGQRFIAWYLRNIHSCDIYKAIDDVTDGPDDKQIDAIVIDDDKQSVFIIQGKFASKETVDGEPLREVLSAWAQVKDLINLQLDAKNTREVGFIKSTWVK